MVHLLVARRQGVTGRVGSRTATRYWKRSESLPEPLLVQTSPNLTPEGRGGWIVIEACTARRECFAGQRFRHGCGKREPAEIPLSARESRFRSALIPHRSSLSPVNSLQNEPIGTIDQGRDGGEGEESRLNPFAKSLGESHLCLSLAFTPDPSSFSFSSLAPSGLPSIRSASP